MKHIHPFVEQLLCRHDWQHNYDGLRKACLKCGATRQWITPRMVRRWIVRAVLIVLVVALVWRILKGHAL